MNEILRRGVGLQPSGITAFSHKTQQSGRRRGAGRRRRRRRMGRKRRRRSEGDSGEGESESGGKDE